MDSVCGVGRAHIRGRYTRVTEHSRRGRRRGSEITDASSPELHRSCSEPPFRCSKRSRCVRSSHLHWLCRIAV